jgi:lipoprotein-anchoring transpeptidase ErfK/SrfK
VTSPKRLTALGGAALVTVLTCAGALGIGPGALGQQSAVASPSGVAAAHGGSSAGDPNATSSPAGRHTAGDNWVTLQDSPTGTPQNGGDASAGTAKKRPVNAVPAHSGQGRRIVYDISAQRVWLVNSKDDVERTYLVSGSKHTNLVKPGEYDVYSMSPDAVSYDGKETMHYMVRFTTGKHSPIGFHDIPALDDGTLVESRSQLGTPQSAGCIRQWITDAKALWEFARVGTRVVVTA